MSLWWLQPGWTATTCGHCGKTIWPDGDPDWGLCYECFSEHLERERAIADDLAAAEQARWEEENQPHPNDP